MSGKEGDFLVVSTQNEKVIADRVREARSFMTRLKGLLFEKSIEENEGLLLHPCKSIHMAKMKFPLDIVFMDEDFTIIATYSNLAPWKRTAWHNDAKYALELKAKRLRKFEINEGDKLVVSRAS